MGDTAITFTLADVLWLCGAVTLVANGNPWSVGNGVYVAANQY